MVQVEYVRELSGFQGSACLVRKGDDYFAVSSADVPYSSPETLVFPADESGEITSWSDVAGGRGMSREDAIADLADNAA